MTQQVMNEKAVTPVLEIRALSAGPAGAPLLAEVTLDLRAGEVLALLGANGAGKSTLLSAVMGMTPLASGAVLLDGRDLAGLGPRARARLGLGYCPAGRRVFPGMSVADNLDVASFARPAERRRLRDEAVALFPQLGRAMQKPAWSLSGGQQQMLAIARALMAGPRLLLLDEPSLGLAPALIDDVLAKLRQVAKTGVAVLLAEQNIGAALGVADRAAVLARGRIAARGDARSLARSADLSRIVMGL
jgi:branched-chain amino acid transport system ATP-binding protein